MRGCILGAQILSCPTLEPALLKDRARLQALASADRACSVYETTLKSAQYTAGIQRPVRAGGVKPVRVSTDPGYCNRRALQVPSARGQSYRLQVQHLSQFGALKVFLVRPPRNPGIFRPATVLRLTLAALPCLLCLVALWLPAHVNSQGTGCRAVLSSAFGLNGSQANAGLDEWLPL